LHQGTAAVPEKTPGATAAPDAKPRPGWTQTLRVYLKPGSLRMLCLGFAAGLPLLLVLGTLSFRLRAAGIERATIGHLSWVGLAYGFKWAWAPLVDRVPIALLTRRMGRRRSWLLLAQLAVMAGLVAMALADPRAALQPVVLAALLVAFASATQDIALDAFRIECAPAQEQPALAASYQTGYRLGMIWAGAGALWLVARVKSGADGAALSAALDQNAGWQAAYLVMAASMLVGVVTVLLAPEPARVELPPARGALEWFKAAVAAPFGEFFARYRWHAALILALIAVYRISDVVMGIMAGPFYVDMGYTEDEVAAVTKVYGLGMTLLGAFAGGALALRFGVMRTLMLGAALSALTNLLFAWLAGHGHSVPALIAVVSADNLASGIASAAFVGYLSSLTSVRYSATQYALFSSLMLLLPKFVAGFSGDCVDAFGYTAFFTGTALLGVPVLALVWAARRMVRQPSP
jgi:PAT family beta-lactamase induction signal transducer AmpG